MRGLRPALVAAVGLYALLDFANPLQPGAVALEGSVDGLRVGRSAMPDPAAAAAAAPPALLPPAAPPRARLRPRPAPPPRPAVRRARLPRRRPAPAGEDH